MDYLGTGNGGCGREVQQVSQIPSLNWVCAGSLQKHEKYRRRDQLIPGEVQWEKISIQNCLEHVEFKKL